MRQRCERCRYWQQTDEHGRPGWRTGICRASLPMVAPMRSSPDVTSVAEATYWPVTSAADWCGHFGEQVLDELSDYMLYGNVTGPLLVIGECLAGQLLELYAQYRDEIDAGDERTLEALMHITSAWEACQRIAGTK